MELTTVINNNSFAPSVYPENEGVINQSEERSTEKPFLQANTIAVSFEEVRCNHIIPVFIKDNEPVISQVDFIEAMLCVANEFFRGERILQPSIRLSHPIKGRIPDAKHKSANELLEHEKTLYYERMAFVIEIPTLYDEIDGNTLSLCLGGIKAYNLDNLYNKKGADEHFKIFIGFQNRVCTNLCIWTDGMMGDLKVTTLGQLKGSIRTLLETYNAQFHLQQMKQLVDFSLSETQFATLAGKCRMYTHLPQQMKNEIPQLMLGDSQIAAVCKDYYKDNSFCRDRNGNINLWRLYNLFTGANKSSYIDNFLDRSVNTYHFIEQVRMALQNNTHNWFLN